MITGLEKINAFTQSLEGKLKPDKNLMNVIAGHMHAAVMENFHNQGSSIPGGKWPPTMFGGNPLLKKGNLIRSIQARATDTEAMAFTNQRGAALMQFGGIVRAKKILGSVKRRHDVTAMEQYFWSQYFKYKKKPQGKLYKILAFHVRKHRSITVPARPFMYLSEPYQKKIMDAIIGHLSK